MPSIPASNVKHGCCPSEWGFCTCRKYKLSSVLHSLQSHAQGRHFRLASKAGMTVVDAAARAAHIRFASSLPIKASSNIAPSMLEPSKVTPVMTAFLNFTFFSVASLKSTRSTTAFVRFAPTHRMSTQVQQPKARANTRRWGPGHEAADLTKRRTLQLRAACSMLLHIVGLVPR